MHKYVFLSGLAFALGLAVVYGGKPERCTAGMFAIAALASHLLYATPAHRYYGVESYVAAVDLVLLGGIAVILARADRFWPIALFAAHGITVLAHVVKLVDPSIIRHAYAISIAAPSYLTLIALIIGTVRHRQRVLRYGADLDWSGDALA